MLLAALAFTLMTTLVKYLGADYPAALQTFYRQLAGLVVILPLIVRSPRAAFETRRIGVMLLRSGMAVAGFILTFESFRTLPLADANALSFTRVLWVVPIAAIFLREYVGPVRIGATLVGFCGVLIMMRPETSGIGWPHIAALGGALALAIANISGKAVAEDHSMLALLTWAGMLGVLASLPPALSVWRWPSLTDFLLLSLMGVAGVAVQYCYLSGMKVADAVAVIPVDYTRLVMAMIVGLLLFDEIPDPVTMLGAAIVIVSTLFIIWREQLRKGRPIASSSASGEDTNLV